MEEKERNDRDVQEIQQQNSESIQHSSSNNPSEIIVSKSVGPFCLRRPVGGRTNPQDPQELITTSKNPAAGFAAASKPSITFALQSPTHTIEPPPYKSDISANDKQSTKNENANNGSNEFAIERSNPNGNESRSDTRASGRKVTIIGSPARNSGSHRSGKFTSNKKKQTSVRVDEAGNKTKIKSRSIHGMTEEEANARPHRTMGALTYQEKKFLLAVERGDVASSRRMLESNKNNGQLDINCCDPLGRTALLMAIDNENLEIIEMLLDNKVETRDALLHAIDEEYVEAVEVLLENEEMTHKEGELHSWEAIPPETASFTPDITPLVLAAHRDNYEIIKILLDRGGTLPMPHDVRCGCDECMASRSEDSLRHSRSRINAYRALASPSLIALSSKDPILTAFELSWELRRLSFAEHEFKSEYLELRAQCQKFATALLDHTRSSSELEILLNHDSTGPVYQHGERMHLNRLKLAIKYRQKKFVAHPNVQQLLASIWYEGLPGFRQLNMVLQFLEVCRIGLLFPFFSICYIVCPWASFSQKLRKPFIKFICSSSSYFTFLFLLILASQRIEGVLAEWLQTEWLKNYFADDVTTKRGSMPSLVEWAILAWVAGFIWNEIKQLWDVGLKEYLNDMWNVVDFTTNSLYVATVSLRLVAYYRVQVEKEEGIVDKHGRSTDQLTRENWDTWDPMLISEGLFAAANIFSNLKLVYIFSVNPYLGPLQVSLSRMVMDILKFISLFVLVLFAFSCGANQLLWYYADLEKKKCYASVDNDGNRIVATTALSENVFEYSSANYSTTTSPKPDFPPPEINHCLAWRRFANLWETSQTLFWAIFGLVDLDNFELTGIKEFTRFFGLLMFGSFSVINIIVLLNLLIAMMNHSYQLISVSSADVEWKFARSKLWISYFEEGGTVPAPFNIIPTPKSIWYLLRWIWVKLCGRKSLKTKKEYLKTTKVRQASERDCRYQAVMRNLVRRYVTQEQRKAENEGVTEDDVNEIKNDISAFRFELIEILRQSGMNTSSATGPGGAAGKKNRQKERRLMKGFNLAAGGAGNVGGGRGSVTPGSAGSGILGKKCSLSVAACDITIDMAANGNGTGKRDSAATIDSNMLSKKSPMHKLARLARLAGTSIGRDAMNNSSGDTSNANSSGLFFNRTAQQNGNDGNNVTLSPTTSHGLNSSSSNQNIEGSHPRKWGKLMQAAAGGNGNKRASIDSTTTATGLAIDTSSTRHKRTSSNKSATSFSSIGEVGENSATGIRLTSPSMSSNVQLLKEGPELNYGDGISEDELIESEKRGSKSSLNRRSNKYERTRGNSCKSGQKQTMQCLNPMHLGPPASKSKGDTLSSKMLIDNSGPKLLGSSSEIQGSTSSAASPSVPTYTQSLLDIDCEGGYNLPSLSPSNDIPLITAPSLTPSPTVLKEKSIIEDLRIQYSSQPTGASTAIQTPNPKDSSITLPSVRTDSKQLSTGPSVSSVPPPASHYYSNYSKNQPSTQGSSSVSQEPQNSSFTAKNSNAGVEPKMATVASAAAAASGIRLSGTTQSATASPQKGNMTSTLPGINSRSQSNSGWL